MDNMKVNNKRLQKLILDTQKSVGQLSKLAYETGVQDGLLKANALNTLKPLDNTEMRWIPCSERLPETKPISYMDCANAMLKMWIDNVLTDGEYNRIMDKLNSKHMADMRGEQE